MRLLRRQEIFTAFRDRARLKLKSEAAGLSGNGYRHSTLAYVRDQISEALTTEHQAVSKSLFAYLYLLAISAIATKLWHSASEIWAADGQETQANAPR